MRPETVRVATAILGLALLLPSLGGCGSGEVKQTPEEVQAMMQKNGHKKMGPAAGGPPAPGAPPSNATGAQ